MLPNIALVRLKMFNNFKISISDYLAVKCKEEDLPLPPKGTVESKSDFDARKKLDPTEWNSYKSNVTYSCPIGFEADYPGEFDEQASDKFKFNVFCDADGFWRIDLNKSNLNHHPNILPCICKY